MSCIYRIAWLPMCLLAVISSKLWGDEGDTSTLPMDLTLDNGLSVIFTNEIVDLDPENNRPPGKLHVGYDAWGRLTLREGSEFIRSDIYIGGYYKPPVSGGLSPTGYDGDGAITLASGSLLDALGTLYVGYDGSGQLSVSGASQVNSANSFIGYFPGGEGGTANVSDAGSSWNSGNLTVGHVGAGALVIESQGKVSSGAATIAAATDVHVGAIGRGSVVVSDAGSLWETQRLTIAADLYNDATLLIESGGRVTSRSAVIGNASYSSGIVTVRGAGSTWALDDDLAVSSGSGNQSRTAELYIRDGAEVNNTHARIGVRGPTGGGKVTVSNGGRWVNRGELDVGNGGLTTSYSTGALLIGESDLSSTAGTIVADRIRASEGTARLEFNQTDEVSLTMPLEGLLNLYQRGSGITRLSNDVNIHVIPPDRIPELLSLSAFAVKGGQIIVHNGTLILEGIDAHFYQNLQSGGEQIIGDGAFLQSAYAGIGTGSNEAITRLFGSGTHWINQGDFNVGDGGVGTLLMDSGSRIDIQSGYLIVGAQAGTGTLVMSGANTQITSPGDLITGHDSQLDYVYVPETGNVLEENGGQGHLLIEKGAHLSVREAFIGHGPSEDSLWLPYATSASGLVTVADADSVLTVSGNLYLGYNDAIATLNIGSPDLMSTAGQVIAGRITTGSADLELWEGRPDFLPPPAIPHGSGTVNFNQIDDVNFTVPIEGNITLNQLGSGLTVLLGDHSYTGATVVDNGKLMVNGSIVSAVTVQAGATLGGSGSLGPVTNAGIITPGNTPETLTINGDLLLTPSSALEFELDTPGVVGGGVNDLIVVNGNLTLDGTLNIIDWGNYGAGIYRLVNYTGSLTDNELVIGTQPAGFTAVLDITAPNEINLIVTANDTGESDPDESGPDEPGPDEPNSDESNSDGSEGAGSLGGDVHPLPIFNLPGLLFMALLLAVSGVMRLQKQQRSR